MKKSIKRTFNYRRFIRVISITLVLMVIMIFTVKSNASGSTKDVYQEVIVCNGDSLWSLSKYYGQGEDIQKVIYYIKKYNNLKNSDIYPGQKLKIPIEF